MGHCISWDGWAVIFEFLDSRAFLTINAAISKRRSLGFFCNSSF